MTRLARILLVVDNPMDAEFALNAFRQVRPGATQRVESAPGRGTRVIIEVARGPA